MGLYWKDIEIVPGMTVDVDFLHHEVFDDEGLPLGIRWKILSFGTRSGDEAYIDHAGGRKFSIEKVVKKRRLRSRLERGELLQLPPGTDFMIVEEYHGGVAVFRRCYNLDLLQSVRSLRVADE